MPTAYQRPPAFGLGPFLVFVKPHRFEIPPFPATMCARFPFLRTIAVIAAAAFCNAAFAELRILPLGDSITRGEGGSASLIPG